MHLSEIVRRQSVARPNDPSYTCADAAVTWRETDDRSARLAGHFVACGLRHGDRVALLARACHRYWEVHFACARAGLIVVPINYRLNGDEVDYIVSDVEASAIVVGAGCGPLAERASVPVRLGFGRAHGQPEDYEAAVAAGDPRPLDVRVDDEDINVIGYTSGTTGRPKGAELTHRAAVLSAYGYGVANRFRSDDVVLSCMPPYVLRGQSAGLSPALVGAHVVTADFDARTVLDLIERHRVTQIQLAPAMINLLLAEPSLGEHDVASVRAIWTGGSPIRPQTLQRLGTVFGDVLGSTFGMTEATGIAGMRHTLSDDPHDIRRLASVGRPLPLLDVEVRRADGTVTDDDEVGEIVVRGDTVMRGYWRDPQATAAVLRHGWFHTGDLAARDRDGYLFIVDRRVDIIVSGGLNVYSLEVENALNLLPGVAESAVFGVPHDVWGEAVRAHVVLAPGTTSDVRTITAGARERLAHFKVPKEIEIVPALARNAMGKVDKKALRAPYWSGRDRAVDG